MEPTEEKRLSDKNSSNQSERKKRRPSLFPIRNSARRKSSMSETHNIFDPHQNQSSSNRIPNRNELNLQTDSRETKSEASFQYHTPSLMGDYQSPRSTRISPKQFVVDTPYVPFVHQSLTKTVWQSQQVIPEERDEMQRKQSQTQGFKSLGSFGDIKQQKAQQDEQLLSGSPMALNQNLKPCHTVSISVSANQSQAKNGECENLLDVQNEIEHNQYVSKANIYYEETKQQTEENQDLLLCKQETSQIRRRVLSFSYLDCISVRPTARELSSVSQQTPARVLQKSPIYAVGSIQQQKISQHCQVDSAKLQVGSSFNEQIKSVKKHSCIVQVSAKQRLALITKNYQEMIKTQKHYIHQSQQAHVETRTRAQQTIEQNTNFSIHQQVNHSFYIGLGGQLDQKIDRLQKYITSLYEAKQEEINQLKSRRCSDKGINTDNTTDLRSSSSSKKKKVVSKSVRNFCCQYDPKDFGGNRSSLKRVSIADTKVIYEIDDSVPSTQTFQEKKSKNKNKKSKGSEEKEKLKIEPKKAEPEEEQDEPTEQPIEEPKRRGKRGKTPKKKKNKN